MSQFVSQHGDHFIIIHSSLLIILRLLNLLSSLHIQLVHFLFFSSTEKGIVENDTLILPESVHVGVGVSGSFGAVDNVEFGEWILERLRQFLDFRLEFTVWEWEIFVEEWSDECRVDSHQKQHNNREEDPDIDIEVWPSVGNNPFDSIDNWHGESESDEHFLDFINEIESNRLFVESMSVFDDESRVKIEWKIDYSLNNCVDRQEDSHVKWKVLGGIPQEWEVSADELSLEIRKKNIEKMISFKLTVVRSWLNQLCKNPNV